MPETLFLILLALILVITYLLHQTFGRSRKAFLKHSDDLRDVDYSFFAKDNAWFKEQAVEDLTMYGLDSIKLHGLYLKADQASSKCVILLHGYSDRARGMIVFARLYHELGFHVLMVDAPAHGESEGKVIGFGYRERHEIARWIEFLNQTKGLRNVSFLLHGVSMGGSTALFALISGLPKSVKGVIADSAYTRLEPVFKRQLKLIYKLPSFPALNLVSLYMKAFLGFWLGDVDVHKHLDRLTLPLLLIHGKSDHFVPYSQSQELYDAHREKTSLWLVENAAHACPIGVDPEGYAQKVKGFLEVIGL